MRSTLRGRDVLPGNFEQLEFTLYCKMVLFKNLLQIFNQVISIFQQCHVHILLF